jgi:segregation and condensation protein B
LKKDDQKCVIEALIFSSEDTLPMKTIISFLSGLDGMDTNGKEQASIDEEIIRHREITPELVIGLIDEINEELVSTNRPFRIVNIAGGWQYATRSEYGELVAKLVKSKHKRRLSQKTLETLAIIAYKQPISKPEIDQIRGVHSGELVNSLLDRGLVKIIGRSEALGKPLLYGTTDEFLKTFGINTLEDLPKLRDLGEFTDNHDVAELEIVIDKMEDAPIDKIGQLRKKIDEGIDLTDFVFEGKAAGN